MRRPSTAVRSTKSKFHVCVPVKRGRFTAGKSYYVVKKWESSALHIEAQAALAAPAAQQHAIALSKAKDAANAEVEHLKTLIASAEGRARDAVIPASACTSVSIGCCWQLSSS